MTVHPLTQAPTSTHAQACDVAARLSDTSAAIDAGDDIETLLEHFLVSILALAGAQAGAVRVLADDGQQLRLVAQIGLPADVLETERMVARDCGICGVAAGCDTLAWVDDMASCARHSPHGYFGLQCRRMLTISLAHGGQILGVYNLFFDAHTQLDAASENMLRLIGRLLGLSLHNARLERERTRVTVLRERQEMVCEVHDAIAQTLTYAKMRLPLLNKAMLAHDDQQSVRYFDEVKQAMGEVHHNLREVMGFFRTRLDPLGLLHALQHIADSYPERTGIALEIRNSAGPLGLDDAQEVQVFHIIQEALANIAKHAMARHALISIRRTEPGLEFLIEDDGKGLAASEAQAETDASPDGSHLGLGIMQARAQRLGAHIDVGNNRGDGTRVRLRLPLVCTRDRSNT